MGVVLRLGRPLPPEFYHVFYRVLYAFFTPITASAFLTRFLRVFYAFFSFLGLGFVFYFRCGVNPLPGPLPLGR